MDKKELKEILQGQTEEIKRHNQVLEENFKSHVRFIAEQYSSLEKKITATFAYNAPKKMKFHFVLVYANINFCVILCLIC